MAWLLADMLLVTVMTVLVKLGGASYPALQMVFIRSLVGLVAILPLAIRHRRTILGTRRPGRHLFRVLCNSLALSANFAALTALPLALANAIGFLRPLVVLALAGWLLGERSGAWRWIGAGCGLVGVLVMLAPHLAPHLAPYLLPAPAPLPTGSGPATTAPAALSFGAGIAAALAAVLFGSLATVQTRALAGESTVALMVFYTLGLTLLTALPAALIWSPVAPGDWALLLGIGILAQAAQYCFLRAYQSSPANVLAPLGYLSIVAASLAGWLAFGEIPAPATLAGVVIIIAALALTRRMERPGS